MKNEIKIEIRSKEQQAIDNLKSIINSKDKIIEIEPPLEDTAQTLLDCITNLQEENNYYFKKNNELSTLNTSLRSDRDIYKSRCEKANWWLKEMLKQAKSEETKAIINGTLELLLNGDNNE